MSSDLSSLAFIGLGTMGLPMAQNLAKKLQSSKLYAYDIMEAFVEQLYEGNPEQVVRCQSSAETVSRASIVITMLPEGKHIRSLYLDPEDGLINADLGDKVLVDCSTIDPGTSIDVKEALSAKYPSARFYDAPVSGGSNGAVKGILTFMLGCSSSDHNLPLLKELLGLMGTNITVCGGHSLGLTAKLCNNYCSSMIALATSEAFNMAIRAGLSPQVLHEIFLSSTAGSCINEKWNPVPNILEGVPSSNDYKPGFRIELMAKDMGLAVDVAEQVGAKLVLADSGLEAYRKAMQDDRCKGKDSRVVYRWLGGVENWRESQDTIRQNKEGA